MKFAIRILCLLTLLLTLCIPVLAAPPIDGGPVTSPFGPRWGRDHKGVDIGVPEGTPVVALSMAIVKGPLTVVLATGSQLPIPVPAKSGFSVIYLTPLKAVPVATSTKEMSSVLLVVLLIIMIQLALTTTPLGIIFMQNIIPMGTTLIMGRSTRSPI